MLAGMLAAGILVFFGMARLLRCEEVSELYGIAKQRRRPPEPGPGAVGVVRPKADLSKGRRRIAEFLNYIRVEKRLALNTAAAYERDLHRYAAFLGKRGSAPRRSHSG